LASTQIPTDNPRLEREQTDARLQTERNATDAQEHSRSAQDDADRVLGLARARADAVLNDARDKADEGSARFLRGEDRRVGASAFASASGLASDREDADAVLEDERSEADEHLLIEREDAARVLSALLPLARNSTDRSLLTERAASDAALGYRDDFLAMVSHDLNNLLGGIMLSASGLARHASETPEGKRIASGTTRIQLYAARMKRLIGDLTDVTSLANGKLAVTTGPYDARTLVAEARDTFRMVAAEKQIALEIDNPEAPLLVVCDHGRILQVLVNLVGNALKFTPEGGNVTARVARVGDEVRFSVLDNGPGIPENLLEAIFERFWQAGLNDRRGLGLGLYIARGIIEAHGGRIWAESRLGSGSAFHFTVPSALSSENARTGVA
ncbi:MAG TPA: ATP-binding protein, partial [Vicinamibacteria bacterium]|nr:ATP-binding protein [Vicinamibacteria bacterium]